MGEKLLLKNNNKYKVNNISMNEYNKCESIIVNMANIIDISQQMKFNLYRSKDSIIINNVKEVKSSLDKYLKEYFIKTELKGKEYDQKSFIYWTDYDFIFDGKYQTKRFSYNNLYSKIPEFIDGKLEFRETENFRLEIKVHVLSFIEEIRRYWFLPFLKKRKTVDLEEKIFILYKNWI
jgi:hypothetical protein